MRYFSVYLCVFLLPALALTPCFQQSMEYGYDGPGDEDEFFAIGWSEDGKDFAHGLFKRTKIGSFEDAYYERTLMVEIHNLVRDTCYFHEEKTWNEKEGDFPSTARGAWKLYADESEINLRFKWMGIRVLSRKGEFFKELKSPTVSFQMENGDRITIDIRKSDCEYHDGYGADECVFKIFVVSEKLGEKVLSTFSRFDDFPIYVYGYVYNPDQSRMAVIIHEYDEDRNSIRREWVMGCHMRAGFKMTGK